MSYVDFPRYRAGQLVDADRLNQHVDNLTALRDVNMVSYFHDGSGSDWSSTVDDLVDIDATKFKLTITTNGGPLLVMFFGTMKKLTTQSIFYGIRREGDDVDLGPIGTVRAVGAWKPVSIIKPYPDLPAGTYTFSAVWRAQGGGTSTLEAKTKPWMAVIESF